jgi:hypothetical protein
LGQSDVSVVLTVIAMGRLAKTTSDASGIATAAATKLGITTDA